MVAYNEDEKDQEGETICTEKERKERERERGSKREKMY